MPRIRDPHLLAGALLALAVTAVGVAESRAWIGQPFPGFLLLANRVVPSAGLTRWPATAGGAIYQRELVAVDGMEVADPGDLHRHVQQLPVGSAVDYRLRDSTGEVEIRVATRRFDAVDYLLLFGSYLICGLALVGTALGIRYLRGRNPMATGPAAALWIIGMYALTAVDLYGPYRLFRLHAVLECFLFAGTLHLALVFPNPGRWVERHRAAIPLVYAAAAIFAAVTQVGLFTPAHYVAAHRAAMILWGLSLPVLIGSQLRTFLRPPSFEARQRVKVLVLGTALALSPQIFLVLSGGAPENMAAFSGVLFPISIGYAVLRHNLLEVDVFVRRTLNYALLTGFVTVAYVAAIQASEALFHTGSEGTTGTLGFAVSVLCVVSLLPLRDRFQAGIDRVFFRTAYDFRRIVETASERLASVADLRVISDEIERAIGDTLHPESIALYLDRLGDGVLRRYGPRDPSAEEAADVATRLGANAHAVEPTDLGGGALCVPFRADNVLVAMLVLGRPLSGRLYGGDDRRLLQTLANQGAVAIENALALEQLRDLNRNLENKVEERTRELRETQAQLVHREKMASVGQFVAGIAHELNNPLNFIQGNLYFLQEYVETLREVIASYEAVAAEHEPTKQRFEAIREDKELAEVLSDTESVFSGCAEGVERSTALVADLRTFSRLDQPERMSVDLHETIDSALNMLRSKLTGVEIACSYAELPKVECLAGQLSQVFMNLFANAADAMDEQGTLTITTAALGEDRVAIEVRDDGRGIPADKLDRIFDPFFTTKDVGEGTGLGLSISYGIIAQHGGAISVVSESGRGATFRIEIPVTDPEGRPLEPSVSA